jgi:hypothetical protein
VSVFIFTGPTLSKQDVTPKLEAVYLPPAAAGDLYRVALQKPQVIGLIDGYFDSTPSIRHKEILWAMSRGIHVFGSASIGALRAAELTAFGMEGIGAIFDSYRNGELEDDDEVAIAHGPPESGFVSLSEAMVNIRHTLRSAEQANVISSATGQGLKEIGKALFYPNRSYPEILRLASKLGLPNDELQEFRDWLPYGRINQKQMDALLMLKVIRERLARGLSPKKVRYSFAHTTMWEPTYRRRAKFSAEMPFELLLDELRFSELTYSRESLLALERFLAREEAARQGVTAAQQDSRDARAAFCRARNLTSGEALAQWAQENDLDDAGLDALAKEEAQIRWVHDRARFLSDNFLPDHLRLSGFYTKFRARAEAKQEFLESLGPQHPRLQDAALTEAQLLAWYCDKVRGGSVPVGPNDSWQALGYSDPDAFRRSLLKEYLFRRYQESKRLTLTQ